MSRATLLAAADLLERSGGWTQHYPARNRSGEHVNPADDQAVCFCTLGALLRSSDKGTYREDIGAVTRALTRSGLPCDDDQMNISTWNDAPGRTQAEVVATVRRAAEMVG